MTQKQNRVTSLATGLYYYVTVDAKRKTTSDRRLGAARRPRPSMQAPPRVEVRAGAAAASASAELRRRTPSARVRQTLQTQLSTEIRQLKQQLRRARKREEGGGDATLRTCGVGGSPLPRPRDSAAGLPAVLESLPVIEALYAPSPAATAPAAPQPPPPSILGTDTEVGARPCGPPSVAIGAPAFWDAVACMADRVTCFG